MHGDNNDVNTQHMPRAQQIKTMLSLMSRLIWTAETEREGEGGEKEKSLEIDDTAAPPSVQHRYNDGRRGGREKGRKSGPGGQVLE